MASSLSCTRKRERYHSSALEERNDDATCSTALSLCHAPPGTSTDVHSYHYNSQPPSNLAQNLPCTDEDHSSEPEDNDDGTPWGVNTALRLFDDPWKIKKVLTASDVQSHYNRLMLPSDMVKNLVRPVLTEDEKSELDSGGRIDIKFWDIDADPMSLHSLVLKKWVSSGSYVLIGNWNGDFVKRRQLKEGDNIGLHWDKFNHRFNFSVLSPRRPM